MNTERPLRSNKAPRQKRKSRLGCVLALVAGLSVCLFLAGIVVFALLALGGGRAMRAGKQPAGMDTFPHMREVWAYGQGEHKAVMIPLRGMIHMDETAGFFGPGSSSSELALRAIRRATGDSKVDAIILDVDSGGGGITASDIIYKALLDFKAARSGRKVVAIYGDVAASGAYYVSLAADHIVARPTSITGSIGVLMQSLDMTGLGQKIGVKDVTIASGKNKALLNPLREMTPEQKRLLQDIVDGMHRRFVNLVAYHRGLEFNEVRKLADGRIFSAEQAVKLKLIDSIGYWNNALAITAELLNVDAVKVYRYEEEFSLSSLLRASQRWQPEAMMEQFQKPPLLYQWNP